MKETFALSDVPLSCLSAQRDLSCPSARVWPETWQAEVDAFLVDAARRRVCMLVLCWSPRRYTIYLFFSDAFVAGPRVTFLERCLHCGQVKKKGRHLRHHVTDLCVACILHCSLGLEGPPRRFMVDRYKYINTAPGRFLNCLEGHVHNRLAIQKAVTTVWVSLFSLTEHRIYVCMHMILWTLGAAGMRPTGPKPDEHGVISCIRTSSIKPVGLDAFPP